MFRVLLADDEKMVLLSTEKTFPFSEYGMTVAARVFDSFEALRLLEESAFDAALIDIRMPGLSGIDIISECRRRNIDTEFIVVSGYSDFDYMKQAIRLGAFDYCLKPLQRKEADELSRRLLELLLRKRTAQDSSRLAKILSRKDILPDMVRLGFPSTLQELTVLYISLPSVREILSLFKERETTPSLFLYSYFFLLSETSVLLLASVPDKNAEPLLNAVLSLTGSRIAYGTADLSAGQPGRLVAHLATDLLLTTKEQPLIRTSLHDENDAFRLLLEEVRLHYDQELSLQSLARKYNFNYSYCSELFKSETGYNFSKYITRLRMNAAAGQLLETADSTTDISFRVGYRNYHHFIKVFKDYFGTTPSEYRQQKGDIHEPEKTDVN